MINCLAPFYILFRIGLGGLLNMTDANNYNDEISIGDFQDDQGYQIVIMDDSPAVLDLNAERTVWGTASAHI